MADRPGIWSMPQAHIQFDAEAAGPPGCTVIAAAFLPFWGPFKETYDASIRLPSIMTVKATEMLWWMQQPPEVQAQLKIGKDAKSIEMVAFEILQYFQDIRRMGCSIHLWSTAWEDWGWLNQILAAKHTSLRDERVRTNDAGTLYRAAKVRTPAEFPGKHIATEDVKMEARVLLEAGKILKIDWDTFGESG